MPLPSRALPQPQQTSGLNLRNTEILGRHGNAWEPEGTAASGVSSLSPFPLRAFPLAVAWEGAGWKVRRSLENRDGPGFGVLIFFLSN